MEKSFTPDWLRLQIVIRSAGMTVNSFAHHIGLKRSENLYQIKKGNHGISKQLAETIHRHFPRFTVSWLLTGEASAQIMANIDKINAGDETIIKVPVYNQIRAGSKPLYCLYISEEFLNGAETAILNKDPALCPTIPVGAMVFLRPTNSILAGWYYRIVTEDFTIIRKAITVTHTGDITLSTTDNGAETNILVNRSDIITIHSVERVLW